MLLAAFLVSLAAFFQSQVLCKNRQQEIGGIRREIGGISRKQVSACRSVCCVSAFFSRGRRFLGFSAEISAAGAFRQKVLPPEGPGMGMVRVLVSMPPRPTSAEPSGTWKICPCTFWRSICAFSSRFSFASVRVSGTPAEWSQRGFNLSLLLKLDISPSR